MLSVLSIFLSPFVFQQNIFVKSKLKYEFPFMFSIRSFLTLSISWMHLDIDLFHQCFQCILGSDATGKIRLQIESFRAILEKFSGNCGIHFPSFHPVPSFMDKLTKLKLENLLFTSLLWWEFSVHEVTVLLISDNCISIKVLTLLYWRSLSVWPHVCLFIFSKPSQISSSPVLAYFPDTLQVWRIISLHLPWQTDRWSLCSLWNLHPHSSNTNCCQQANKSINQVIFFYWIFP